MEHNLSTQWYWSRVNQKLLIQKRLHFTAYTCGKITFIGALHLKNRLIYLIQSKFIIFYTFFQMNK